MAQVPGNCSRPLVGHLGGRCGRLCALGLLFVLCAIVPLAHAIPPDPLWMSGIYDGADFDEVLAAVTSATEVAERLPLAVAEPTIIVARPVGLAALVLVSPISLSACPVRSPPS